MACSHQDTDLSCADFHFLLHFALCTIKIIINQRYRGTDRQTDRQTDMADTMPEALERRISSGLPQLPVYPRVTDEANSCSESSIKLEFHGTDTDTDTDTDTEILADFRARIVARMSACLATSPFSLPRAGHARRSSPTCLPTCPTRALFLARILARMSVGDARVYTCKRSLYYICDKLSCTRLQNYTIGASLMSVSVSVSVSVLYGIPGLQLSQFHK